MTKQKPEVITVLAAVEQAVVGNYEEIERMVKELEAERDQLVQLANQKISSINGQIQLLTTLWSQARTRNKPNGLD